MSADRDIRRLTKLLDVDPTGIAQGDVPTWDTNVSSFTMAPSGSGGFDLTVGGNSTSGGAGFGLVSSGTMTLAGGTNITLSQDGNAVTIIGGAGSAGTQTFIGGIQASDATYTSGTVIFTGVGGGVTVKSGAGQHVDISVAAPVAQSVQTQNVIDMTLDGNTAGVLALMSSGTVTLAGGNNITLSQAGNAVTISAANQSVQPETQTFLGAIQNSQTTYTSGTVSLSVLAGNLTIRSTTGQAFQFSASQSVQTQDNLSIGVSTAGNTSGNTTVNTGSRMVFVGTNNITLSQGTGAGATTITISGPTIAADTQTAISGIANSQTTYTSGTVSLSELGAITIRSTTGNQFQFSVNSQSVQPETQTFVGGISNSQTTYTSGTIGLSELGAITIRSTTGNQFQFSVNSQSVQPETQTFLGGIQNSQTTYTSGTVNLSVVGGNMTIRSTTGNAFQFSVSQSNQAETQTAISGIVASDATYTSGTVTITGVGGGVTVNSNTGQRVDISVAAPIAATNLSVGVSSGGNTSGNTTVNTGSRLVFAGGNNITLSQGTAAGATTVTISGPNTAAATNFSAGISNTGNTAGATGVTGTRIVLVGTNAVSLSQTTDANGGTVTWNVATTPSFSAGVSNTGNTAGATGVSGTRLVLVGTNNITLSQTTDASGATVSISGGAAGTGAFSGGVSNVGNTAGSTGITGTRLVFVGTNNISLSQSTDASGGTISFNDTLPSFSAGVSNLGNTAGSTGVSGTRLVIVGTSGISLSQSTDASGATVTINTPQEGTISMFPEHIASTIGRAVTSTATVFSTAATTARTSVTGVLWPIAMSQNISANLIRMQAANSITSATTTASWQLTLGQSLGLYSLNVNSLSLISSFSNKQQFSYNSAAASTNASVSWTMSYGSGAGLSESTSLSTANAGVTGFWSSVSNIKAVPYATGAFSLSAGQYFALWGFSFSSASAALGSLVSLIDDAMVSNMGFQQIGKNVASFTAPLPLQGVASFTQTDTAMPVALSTSDFTLTATATLNVVRQPFLQMVSAFS